MAGNSSLNFQMESNCQVFYTFRVPTYNSEANGFDSGRNTFLAPPYDGSKVSRSD